jgi:DNA-binding transcriptional regulator YiaG
MTYGEKVHKLRDKLILSQSEMAAMLGVTFATVNRWENGKHEPSIKQKRAIHTLCVKYGIEEQING